MANKTIESGMIYVGIPPTGAVNSTFFSSASTQQTRLNSCSHGQGVLAFFVGAFLACGAWIGNQGWTIVALLVFGEFSWAPLAWKHILLLAIGSFFTTIAFSGAFNVIFSSILEDLDDEKGNDGGMSAYKKDMSDALHDLGELGMVTGYFGSMCLFATVMEKQCTLIGIKLDPSIDEFNSATMIFMLLWVLYTKMRDYNKAVKRVNSFQSQDVVFSYVPNCGELADYEHLSRQC